MYKNNKAVKISVAFIVVLAVSFMYQQHVENERTLAVETANANAVRNAWPKWASFRDANCKYTQHISISSEKLGKSKDRNDVVAYECDDGNRYVLPESINDNVKKCLPEGARCTVDVKSIPVK